MPTFCGNCGAPFNGAGKFCGSCGAPIASVTSSTEAVASEATKAGVPSAPVEVPQSISSTPTPSMPAPSYTSPPTVSTGGGSAMKIILIILAVLVLLGLLGMGSCMYVAYRAKQKLSTFAEQMEAKPYKGKKDPCALVSMAEVSDALGETVSGMEPVGMSACVYHFGNGQMAIETTWEGGKMTMGLAHGTMKQISGMETFTKVDGLGDEAYIAPMGSMLMMRKGDVMVSMDLRAAGLNVEAAKQIAKKISRRL